MVISHTRKRHLKSRQNIKKLSNCNYCQEFPLKNKKGEIQKTRSLCYEKNFCLPITGKAMEHLVHIWCTKNRKRQKRIETKQQAKSPKALKTQRFIEDMKRNNKEGCKVASSMKIQSYS